MSAGDLALVVATVLCALGFTALVVALVFVLRSLSDLRGAVDKLTAETEPLLAEMRRSLDEARGDLDGSTRCSARPRRSRRRSKARRASARVAFSTPVIKTVAIASGTTRAARRFRRR